MAITNTIKSIQDIMREDTGVDGDAQRISQLTWMLFLKIYDDQEKQYEAFEPGYKSTIPETYRWRNWADDDEGLTGDALIGFINNDMFPALKALKFDKAADPRGYIVKEVLEDAYNYVKSGTVLRRVINKLNEIDFNQQADRHQFGDIYETLLKSLQSAGNAGEYYTPRAVTKFVTEMINPKLGDKVFDPACGTGGFLINAIEHIRANAVKTPEDEKVLEGSIFGVEKKPLPHLLCVTNMILHGIEVPQNIRRDNTLTRPLRDYTDKDRVDIILTNPPFGGIEEAGIKSNFPKAFQTTETADLFLILIIKLLKNGGRAGMVLPNSILFGEGVKTRIKEELLNECNLHTIVRLPGSIFAPYTSIATNLLFFVKGEPTKEVWFYELKLPKGVKSYNKTNPVKYAEFSDISNWWNNRVEGELAWKVGIEEIKSRNYNLDFKNPNTDTEEEIDFSSILDKYREKQRLINDAAIELKRALVNSLGHIEEERIRALVDNIGEFVHIPGSVEMLREAILSMAVTGQLVPQDPSDNSIDDLLKQLKAEKEKLLNEGKIRKIEQLRTITEEEQPHKLPNSWKWLQLVDIGITKTGKTPPTSNSKNYGGDMGFIGPGQISEKGIKGYVNTISNEGLSYTVTARPSSTLMVCIGGSIGKSVYIEEELSFNQQINSVSPYSAIDDKYIFYILRSSYFQKEVHAKSSGAATPIINLGKWSKILVPLPSTKEQKRIVAKIDELMSLCDELESKLVVGV